MKRADRKHRLAESAEKEASDGRERKLLPLQNGHRLQELTNEAGISYRLREAPMSINKKTSPPKMELHDLTENVK